CTRHKGDLQAGPVIYFAARCKISGCKKVSRWGLAGKQPTHCPHHGRLEDGLVRTVRDGRGKNNIRSSSYGVVQGASFHVKTEVSF
ncbi:unnamed protein product, partial [Laminaria digitata]